MSTIRFTADIGGNHNQDFSRAEQLVAAAKECGCHGIKVQLFRADRLYAPEFAERIDKSRDFELPPVWLPALASQCRQLGLEFQITPFDLQSLELARPYADAIKIASYSILDLRLIEAAADCGKPVIISTGLADPDEINEAFTTARTRNHRVSLYHCAALYPAPPVVCDLEMITIMRDRYGSCGWSDHSRQPAVIHYAVALGADAVEFHLDLQDGEGIESRHGHCWTPAEIAPVIAQTRMSADALKAGLGIDFSQLRRWRNDPDDEMRPLKRFRQELRPK